MSEIIREYVASQPHHVKIDRSRGILYGVKILGTTSKNHRTYPIETLKKAIPLYENAKVNLNHPEGDPRQPRNYQDRLGVIRAVAVRDGEGLFANFHFNPKHPLAEQLLWDAENAPENVGFSHNVEAMLKREEQGTTVEEILAVRSVDLVADPASTSGLFESMQEQNREKNKTPDRENCDCSDHTDRSGEIPQPLEEDVDRIRKERDSLLEALSEQGKKLENEKERNGIMRVFLESLDSALKKQENRLSLLFQESFLNTLFTAPQHSTVQSLLEDRIALLQRFSETENTPLSRSQVPFGQLSEQVRDSQSFVKAIT